MEKLQIYKSTPNELYPGVTLKEVRIFIIEKCREYVSEGFGLPRNVIIVDDCFKKFYNGNEPEDEVFTEWIFKYKYEEVKKYYRNEIMSKQLKLLF